MALAEFQSIKQAVQSIVALSKDALHIYASLAVFLVGASTHDILNTMFRPTILWLLACFSRVMK